MKADRKIWQVEEEKSSVRAGIIGSGKEAIILQKKLIDKNCSVVLSPIFSSIFSGCRYIFMMADFRHWERVMNYCRRNKVRLVAVFSDDIKEQKKAERELEKEIIKNGKVRLLKVGDINSWEEEKLAETILWVMFSDEIKKNIIDFSKERIFSVVKETDIGQRWGNEKRTAKKYRMPSWSKYSLLLLFLILPVILLLGNFLFIAKNITGFETNAREGHWDSAAENLRSLEGDISINTKMLGIAEVISGPFGSEGLFNWQKLNEISQKSLEMGKALVSAREIFVLEKEKIFSTNQGVDKESVNKISGLVEVVDKDLTEIETDTGAIELPFFPKKEIMEKTKNALKVIEVVKTIMPMAISLAGEGTSHKYLILFQNNLELRPTGGFIGSYGILNIKSGRMESFTIHDVYEADGQLKAHVDPPLAIRNFLSQPNWFLRDSNFDPDFAVSSQQAEWFLEKETGEKVDGVIGMNLNLLKEVIKVLGGVYLPDYQENINADNLFIKTTVYAQKGFFPGSMAKADFLGSLSHAILFTLTDSDKVNWPKMLQTLEGSLEEKNLLFYFNDEGLQKIAEKNGWGGRMVDINCTAANCFPDYLSIIEANLGVNKANLYVKKEVSVRKKIDDDGTIETEVKMDYSNGSPENIFPSGDYKNYMRIYIPKGAAVNSLTVDDLAQNRFETRDYGKDKEEIGLWLEVPPQGKRNVTLNYILADKLIQPKRSYQFFYEKQPGEVGGVNLDFSFPKGWRETAVNFAPTKSSLGFSFNTDSAVDRVFIFNVIDF